MEYYDMYISLYGFAAIESANAQLSIDLDLTDRGAVEDFLCGVSSVGSFSELAELIGMPESSLRQMMNRTVSYLVADLFGLEEEWDDLIRKTCRVFYILLGANDFAEQVGFHPASSRSSSEEADEQLDINIDQAYSFIVSMSAQYGKDFASYLFNVIRRVRSHPDDINNDISVDINVDRFDLLTAIVESKGATDFASITDVPLEAVITLFDSIGRLQEEIYEGASYTWKEHFMVQVRIMDVLLDLGFFSWE